MVGKWHLGYYQPQYTPQRRGFDSFYGYYTGNEEYWNHTSPCWHCGVNFTALDLHHSEDGVTTPDRDQSGVYSTNLFTTKVVDIIDKHDVSEPLFLYAPYEAVHGAASCEPSCNTPSGDLLQAPQYYIDQQSHIQNKHRRTYAGMVGALDDGVKNITEALKKRGLWNNTVLLFTTDNGAPSGHFEGAAMSNAPLRGTKAELWEGGVRGAAFITGPGITKVNYFNKALIHCSDWYPTFVTLAGGDLKVKSGVPPLDGYNVWKSIANDEPSPRTEILHNIDPISNHAAIRVGDWKLLKGMNPGKWWPQANKESFENAVSAADQIYLYNVALDPEERNNLASVNKDKVSALEARLAFYKKTAVPVRFPDLDKEAIETATQAGNLWVPWQKDSN